MSVTLQGKNVRPKVSEELREAGMFNTKALGRTSERKVTENKRLEVKQLQQLFFKHFSDLRDVILSSIYMDKGVFKI